MNELVDLITQRTGLSNDMAQKVVQIVADYMKTRVPEPMASQLTSMLGTQSGSSGNPMGNVMGDLGGMNQNQPPHR